MQKIAYSVLAFVLIVVVCFGGGYLYRGQRGDSSGAVKQADGVAESSDRLLRLVEDFEGYRRAAEERIGEINRLAAEQGRIWLEINAIDCELAQTSREFTGRLTTLEDEISRNIERGDDLADDIGRFIPAVEGAEE